MRKNYLSRLTAAARWRLGGKDAEEVIADYRDIIGDPPRPEEELYRDLGEPVQAVRALVEPKAYRRWLTVLGVLAVCILLPAVSPLPGGPYFVWERLFYQGDMPCLVLSVVGSALGPVWFRRGGRTEEALPRPVRILLAILLTWIAATLIFNWVWMHDPSIWTILGQKESPLLPGWMVYRLPGPVMCVWEWGGFLIALLGVFALIKARMRDRRWAAVYVLALSAMLVSAQSLALLSNMSLAGYMGFLSFLPEFLACAAFAAIGLVGTGASLC